MAKKTTKGDLKRTIVAEFHARVDRAMRAVALDAQAKLMIKTPVDTGRARANWNTTVGSPDVSTNATATRADVNSRRRAGAATIRAAKFSQGEVVYIANGLPYIEALEHGSSKQAPNGMLASTMASLKPTLDDISAMIKRETDK